MRTERAANVDRGCLAKIGFFYGLSHDYGRLSPKSQSRSVYRRLACAVFLGFPYAAFIGGTGGFFPDGRLMPKPNKPFSFLRRSCASSTAIPSSTSERRPT